MKKHIKIILLTALIFISSILLLNACSKQDQFRDLRRELADIKNISQKNSQKSAITNVRLPTPVVYGVASIPLHGASGKALDPLQTYPLSQLQFVGIVSENNQLLAYISTADGKIFSVKVGDKIGDHDGKIITIDQNKIEVSQKELVGSKLVDKIVVLHPKEIK